ncbi:MAG: TonB-dependent receptor [Candidatus Pseudobacter hemicellulosilyticus]|uniref:TonB-dependent receptor n=1 Tax=Candidatus Pseudobacter hemicellulosilyticus TaxID=3121375 RepID=A0AAJ6BHH5_9BACT|nr:MAG: TonB-dependent receptor [Pseudobacter sp.]
MTPVHSLLQQQQRFAIRLLVLLFLLPGLALTAQESNIIEISGQVVDQRNTPISDVSILIKGSVAGTITNNSGNFLLRTKQKLPFTLIISSVGFQQQELEVKSLGSRLQIALATQTVLGNEVVVTASRVAENILRSPVAIEKLDIRAIRETPAPSFYDALENVKGVQMTTSSLTFKVPNTRGFNIPNNFRFMQLVDGVDMQAATLGVPLGNAIGPTELDIASVEITPGAASALYGMNAINGMANLLTKSPFTYQGLSLYQKTGINHVDGIDRDPSILTESAFRYAKAFNNKFAFKVNGSFLRGTDWVSNTRTDQNPNRLNTANPNFSELGGGAQNNPAYDAWNRYGDENNNAVTIQGVNYNGSPRTFILRRTGYWEKDVVKPVVDNLKFDLALHYRLTDNAELSYSYRIGKMDGVFQRGNKIQLDNVIVQNHKLELKGHNYFVRTYMSIENTGDSYNIKPLTDNLQLTHLSNKDWGTRFKTSLQGALDGGADLASAMRTARQAADAGRVEPGTQAFDDLKNTIIGINNWDHKNGGVADAPATGGAWLLQKSRVYHTDAQYDLSNKIRFVDLLLGADVRIYEVIPDGNNFVDFSRPVGERNKPVKAGSDDFGKNVYYKKYGAFVQATKTFFEEKLKVFASLRFDHNTEFDPKLNPRVAVVYTVAEKHNFRASFQNGFRFPALFEAMSFVNNGNVRRVGGLSYINEGLGYLENSYTLASVNAFNAAYNKDRDPALPSGTVDQNAALKNRALLEITNLATTRPERINSLEAGYKSVLLSNRLVLDIDAYYNVYDGFLGQVEVAVPATDKVGTDASVTDMLADNRSKQTRYRVYTNAKNKYRNYGSSLGITYIVYKKYTVGGNINYNDIVTNKTNDVFVTGFNTPKYLTNLSFGNREVAKNLGFNIVWKWQDAFNWESPLANGRVPAYSTIDAQVSYRIPEWYSTIKAGGANVFNKRYIQYAAGPTIGGLYYVAITVDGLLK